jgi:hypothetical protein
MSSRCFSYGTRLPVGLFFACAALGASAVGTPLHAEPSAATASDAREQQRTTLYKEGVELAEAERWDEALKRFQAVVAIRSAPAALFARGTAEEKLGKLTTAKRTYAKARDDAGALADRALAERAASKLGAIEPRIARLTFRLSRANSGAVVSIDGEPIEPFGEGLEIDPGEHHVVVALAGNRPYDQRLALAEGEKKEIWVDLGAAAEADSPFTPPIGPLILGGTGFTAAVVGAIVWLNAKPVYDDARRALNDCGMGDLVCADEAKQRGDAARDRVFAGSLVAGVGALAVAGAGVWWVLSASAHRAEEQRPSSSLGVSATALKGGFGVSVNGAF